jgi:hypothetical protein
MLGSSCVAEQLAASQEGLSSMSEWRNEMQKMAFWEASQLPFTSYYKDNQINDTEMDGRHSTHFDDKINDSRILVETLVGKILKMGLNEIWRVYHHRRRRQSSPFWAIGFFRRFRHICPLLGITPSGFHFFGFGTQLFYSTSLASNP